MVKPRGITKLIESINLNIRPGKTQVSAGIIDPGGHSPLIQTMITPPLYGAKYYRDAAQSLFFQTGVPKYKVEIVF